MGRRTSKKVLYRGQSIYFDDAREAQLMRDLIAGTVAGTDSGSDERTGGSAADITAALNAGLAGQAGYEHTGAFADKPLSNSYVWEAGGGVTISQAEVDADLYKVFSLSSAVHAAVDNPYWTDPTPTGNTGIGLFQGANLPDGVEGLFDFDFDYDTAYPTSSGTGYEGSTGRIDLSDLRPGDQLRVRFDFNAIPQIANTTIEPALWYSNRDSKDDITFTFPLTSQPVFYGTGTVGNTYLNRVELSAWIASEEDVNSLSLPAIKSDNPITIQPLGMLVTIIR
jgi:hypothetical protein